MCPSPTAQLGSHDQQMLKAAGVTPLPSGIGRDWRQLDAVCSNMAAQMRGDILTWLRARPKTFALCEGLCRDSTGYLWWDNGWVWERWHWDRWPVERIERTTLAELAFRIGARV